MKIFRIFRQLFCKHQFEKTGYFENIAGGILYSIRIYKCQKCGKEIHVDGRHDKYAK